MTHYPAHSRIYNIKSDSLETPKIITGKQHSVSGKTISSSVKDESTNSLSGLLAHYDSDSEQEELNGQETNKLDAKVDDFLQEINNIVPEESKTSDPKTTNTQSCAWQECFDKSTGYPYYWNMYTNAVTWEVPEEYKTWLTKNISSEPKPHLMVARAPPEQKKIDTIIKKAPENPPLPKEKKIIKLPKKKVWKRSSDSDDEKIVMITSFSEESSSESENENKEIEGKKEDIVIIKTDPPVVMGPHIEDIPKEPSEKLKKEIIENVKENIDETIILARLRTQAKVLHELGGELPKNVDKSIISEIPEIKTQSLALVAGYGDDSETEEEPSPVKSLFPIPALELAEKPTEQVQSTLFPVPKSIDVKQFEIVNKPQIYSKENEAELVDNKVFKRKKRLGIQFEVSKVEKRPKIEDEIDGEERKGFGFQLENNEEKNDKMSFVKSGIAFVKADILNPCETKREISKEKEENMEDFEEVKAIVSEKVSFLGEGKDPVSAVQVMAIQLQTLELAYKTGGLTRKYLYSWLKDTFVDLEKLEQDAAPDGWQCQWDRSIRRYFYRNEVTAEWQWDFPADIVGGGDAMDICTTPPPNDDVEEGSSYTPSPPPPPSITERTAGPPHGDEIQPPIPSSPPAVTPPPPPTISVSENQPLPPGVDSPDLPFFTSKVKEKESTLGLELDSFYSDIALLEATSTTTSTDVKSDLENVPSPSTLDSVNEVVKKKKKSKSKLGQGINMKKKAVSTLVEKWKKVQNDYL